mgnify:FL=1
MSRRECPSSRGQSAATYDSLREEEGKLRTDIGQTFPGDGVVHHAGRQIGGAQDEPLDAIVYMVTAALGFSAMENALFLFTQGKHIERILQQLEFSAEKVGEDQPQPKLFFYRSPDTHGEIFSLASSLQKLQQVEVDETTAIVLPSPDTLFPVLHHSLSMFSSNLYNISLGYSITRTPIYSFFQSLLDLLISQRDGKFSVRAYVKFILHPYTKNLLLKNRADVTRILFQTIETFFSKQFSPSFFSLEILESQQEIFETVSVTLENEETISSDEVQQHLIAIHNNTIRKFLAIDNIGSFASHCKEILEFLYEKSTAKLHPFFNPFAERFSECLEELSSSSISRFEFASIDSYAIFLRNYFSTIETHFPGTPIKGLQALGFFETRNLKFKRVFFLDINEDIFPGVSRHTMAILPESVKEKLGLVTSQKREQLLEYYFDTLTQSSDEMHLFFVDDGKREKSRFVEKLLWEKQKEHNEENADTFISNIANNISLRNAKPKAIKKTKPIIDFLKHFRYNATALDSYLQCQLKFYYRYVLHLQEKEQITDDVEQFDIGNIVHESLKTFFSLHLGEKLTRKQLNESQLQKILEEQFLQYFGENPTGKILLLQKQIEKQLLRFLRDYQLTKIETENIVINDVEFESDVTVNGWNFSFRIDRIETRGENIFILDYKTGSSVPTAKMDKLILDERSTWKDAIGSFQLPLYAILFSHSNKTLSEKITPAFLLLGKNNIDSSIEKPLFENNDSRQEIYSTLTEIEIGRAHV